MVFETFVGFVPRSGCNLQPRVAAAATLGVNIQSASTPMGLRPLTNPITQRSRGGNAGLEVATASRYLFRHLVSVGDQDKPSTRSPTEVNATDYTCRINPAFVLNEFAFTLGLTFKTGGTRFALWTSSARCFILFLHANSQE